MVIAKKSESSIDKMKMAELKQYARDRGFYSGHSGDKKAILIAHIKKMDGVPASGSPIRAPASPKRKPSPKKKVVPKKKAVSPPRAVSSDRPAGWTNQSIARSDGLTSDQLTKMSKPDLIKLIEKSQGVVAKKSGIPAALPKTDLISLINSNRCDMEGQGCADGNVCDLRNNICRPNDSTKFACLPIRDQPPQNLKFALLTDVVFLENHLI
ncbi:MAG: hypothetical protein JKX76_01230 [Colwellia sp.]|nr:hypothetical protein [Colwellia sp.]